MDFAQNGGISVRVDVWAEFVVAETHTLVGVEVCGGRGDDMGTEDGFVIDVEVSTLAASRHRSRVAPCPVV